MNFIHNFKYQLLNYIITNNTCKDILYDLEEYNIIQKIIAYCNYKRKEFNLAGKSNLRIIMFRIIMHLSYITNYETIIIDSNYFSSNKNKIYGLSYDYCDDNKSFPLFYEYDENDECNIIENDFAELDYIYANIIDIIENNYILK